MILIPVPEHGDVCATTNNGHGYVTTRETRVAFCDDEKPTCWMVDVCLDDSDDSDMSEVEVLWDYDKRVWREVSSAS